jgi:hypothetical protein
MKSLLLAFGVVLALIPGPPEATWTWPTQGPHVVLRDFRAPPTPWGAGHRGLDLGATGTRVIAPVAGVVTFSGVVVDRGVLTITTPTGDRVSLEPVTAGVEMGATVSRGQEIAALEEGHCPTLCLHIGLRTGSGDQERYRSPRRELGIELRAVLLPWNYALG